MHGEIPPGESFEELLDLFQCALARQRLYPLEERDFIRSVQPVAIQRPAEVIRSGYEKLPQHFRLPRRQRFGIHGVNVRISQQAQSLKPFLRCDGLCKSRNGCRVEDIPALHGGGHVEVMFDKEADFLFLFGRKFQPLRGAFESGEAARDVILRWHSFSDIVQQQRQDEQVSPLGRLPERRKMRPSRVRRICQFLQVFDGPQGVLVNGIAVTSTPCGPSNTCRNWQIRRTREGRILRRSGRRPSGETCSSCRCCCTMSEKECQRRITSRAASPRSKAPRSG